MAEAVKPSTQRNLVPLDGSPLAELALREAVALSKLPDTEAILLQVIPPIEEVIMLGLQQIAVDEQWELQREQALHYLHGVSARPEWRGVQVNVAVDMGKPAETILAFAEKHGIGRIVMSTHGRTGIGRWVFGSGRQSTSRNQYDGRPCATLSHHVERLMNAHATKRAARGFSFDQSQRGSDVTFYRPARPKKGVASARVFPQPGEIVLKIHAPAGKLFS